MNLAGVHHLTIRVQDPAATRRFWEEILGLQFMEIPVSAAETRIWRGAPEDGVLHVAQVGNTFMVFAPPLEGTSDHDRFSEDRIGLDHLAFGVDDRGELESLVERVRGAGVTTEGIETDPVLGKEYVCFRDPDNLQIEAYMA